MQTLRQNSRYLTILYVGILLVTPIKIWYALTRPLFYSGPDAPTYIPAAIDFANKGFFEKGITGMPNWPGGYPWIQSIIVLISEQHWIQLVQVAQIVFFSISLVLFFKLISCLFNTEVGFYSSILILMSPAWAVANGESMYETSLFCCVISGAYFLYCKNNILTAQIWGAVLFGMAIAIHPRIIPIVITYLIFVTYQTQGQNLNRLALYFTLPIIPAIFAVRNFIAEGTLTLSSALGPSLGYHKSLDGCSSLVCVPSAIYKNSLEFFRECAYNFFIFWSPHSGPLERGSWFHNISLLKILDLRGFSGLSELLSLITVVLGIILAIAGIVEGRSISKRYSNLLFSQASIFILTDVLIFGDNRHRLVAQICIVPFQILGLKLCRNLFVKSFRN